MKICPRCNKRPAVIHAMYGVIPCDECRKEDDNFQMKQAPEFYSISKSNRVTEQRDKFAKDIEQPFVGKNNEPNINFAKAYPERVNDYYSPEDLRKL